MKRRVTAVIAIIMVLSIFAGSVTAALPSDALWQNFETPPDRFKSRPLWFWNDSLENTTEEDIREIMTRSKAESGYFGFGILPNWINGYLTPRYLELYRCALETAKELGMKMCLYDENGFPSGRAGGILDTSHPDATLKRLDKTEKTFVGPTKAVVTIPSGQYRTYLGAVAMNTDTKEITDISNSAVFMSSELPGVYSSSNHPAVGGDTYTADRAFDGNYSTRWNAGQSMPDNQWLQVVYSAPTTVSKVAIREALDRITSYAVQYKSGDEWVDISTGTSIGANKTIDFTEPVTAESFRLMMYTTSGVATDTASIYEMELFDEGTKIPTPTAGSETSDRVEYDLPAGNFKVVTYATVKDGRDLVDYLSEDAVDKFINVTHEVYYEHFEEYFGDVIDSAFYDEPPLYHAQGRTWTGEFNTLFEEKHGYNPVTLYPALWEDIGEDTQSARTALLKFRTELFAEKYIKNMNDWCNERGIQLTGHMDQEENVNPVSSDGDLMKCFKFQDIPGVDEVFSYDRARKAYKVVSSSAYNWDKGLVMTETYGAMGEGMGIPVMYKDIMNQFAKGINLVVPHAIWHNNTKNVVNPPELSYRSAQYGPELPAYNNFTGRVSSLLQDGRHVADIGVLYPIDTLEAGFMFDVGDPYHGNITPTEADYMEVGDLLSATIRRDFTYLHPEVIDEKCTVEGSILKLNNTTNFENYKVMIMPGSKTISLAALRKIKAFYNAGGKVIATTQLPYMSSEKGGNAEVVAIVTEMFDITAEQLIPDTGITYSASSFFKNDPTYAPSKAFDGILGNGSRWNAGDQSGGNQWLAVDFGKTKTVSRVVISENSPYRVTKFRVQYHDGAAWVDCANGTSIGSSQTVTFPEVSTDKLRLYIDTITSDSVSVCEMEVYNGESDVNLARPSSGTAESSNANGGRTIFLGTAYKSTLQGALDEVLEVYDVEIDPVSTTGGDLTYIHKVKDNTDIYYFANSSDNAISTYVNIGKPLAKPMIWNPHDGTKYEPEYTVTNGVTRIKLDISAVKSAFVVDEGKEEKPPVRGDLDGDGKADVSDVIMMRNWIMEGNPDQGRKDKADLDGDGKIDVSDVVKLRNIIMGVE